MKSHRQTLRSNIKTYTGETDLVFFTGIKNEENTGIKLNPGEEASLNLHEIGDSNNVAVENLSHNKTGDYLVKYITN